MDDDYEGELGDEPGELDEDLVDECMCDFEPRCGGTGDLDCTGCGGDLCVCLCGGSAPCMGCDECEAHDELDELERRELTSS